MYLGKITANFIYREFGNFKFQDDLLASYADFFHPEKVAERRFQGLVQPSQVCHISTGTGPKINMSPKKASSQTF